MIINISSYRFIELTDLVSLKNRLLGFCNEHALKGTILISPEGVNLNLAGERENIDAFIALMQADERFAGMNFKESYSKETPFLRMLVKVKPEIITFRVAGIDPAHHTAAHMSATLLKQWLDEGKDFTLLDTRNRHELTHGKFAKAEDLAIDNFSDFPLAAKQMDEAKKNKPLVMYCTGGVRCEKAGALLMDYGFKEVYQLDGGILQYFEDVGGAHYQGDCFVFDGRGVVDPSLKDI